MDCSHSTTSKPITRMRTSWPERERWRTEYLERVLRVVHQELEETDKGETTESYQAAVRAVSS